MPRRSKGPLPQNDLNVFKHARDRILQRKQELESELQEINQELGSLPQKVAEPAGQISLAEGRSAPSVSAPRIAPPTVSRRAPARTTRTTGPKAQSLSAEIRALPTTKRGRRKTGSPSFTGPKPNISLTGTIREILQAGPITKEEIHQRLEAMGFKFHKNWKITLDSVLFTKAFQRKNGLFFNTPPSEVKRGRPPGAKKKAAPAQIAAPAPAPAAASAPATTA
jgi:hypothetical protein